MWMRLIRSHGLPEAKLRSVVGAYREKDLPQIETAAGFLGIALGENPIAGSIGSVTLWETQQAMHETERLSEEARERAIPLYETTNPMLIDHFKVTFLSEVDADSPGTPHLRLVRFTGLTPEAIETATETYREETERLVRDTPGLVRAAVGANWESGSMAIVSFWASARAMARATQLSEEVRDKAAFATRTALTPLVDRFQITIASGIEGVEL